MNFEQPSLPTNLVVWFGVMGAPLAWVGFHLVGVGVADSACTPPGGRWGLQPNTWAIALTIACGMVAVAAIATATWIYLRTQVDDDAPPPIGRIHFLATIGIVVGFIFLFIILMAGLGSSVLERCVQS